jgi:CDGSH-type Zn-finger protein
MESIAPLKLALDTFHAYRYLDEVLFRAMTSINYRNLVKIIIFVFENIILCSCGTMKMGPYCWT